MKNDCLFCKIARKEEEAKILYEDEFIMVILDAYPDTEGHALVIPKKHYEDIYSVDDDTLLKMISIAKTYAQKEMKALDKDALTFLINYGKAQVIKHLHLHLLPDYMNKKNNLTKEEVYEKIMKE